ncbi:MAG: Enolase [Parcubacteria group bacterium GW2011_GWC1_35_8]|uniref:Enolase n=2 Tax=Candidatus Nomuraibacteriota TaxID=1752729 RepID=A0A1F6YRZ1_9BACT|nr:MAG: Enolase [Parcubacteria group bacterium GW2011_GWC1_35_8]KKP88403.1 MAG: Enolase [Candidatus Nomurabacteria bacterium GW2011_GWC2_35_8]OGJ05055.1 MAG: phosphopyruvate hydratase [Candidatus Nomurabacteria bacterium RIFOXYA2_FULL_35_9]OGJ09146.1 MAG: phosphopyruvate hydratase [Candidatus Nomurabacteria bacterium RIFOXYC2_FULL_36_19]OGJ14223.1 MAG: phosphopyruvate hydratase [Candidatus Nomurabacteria bacterium RIFOXYD2_FULL_35_12]
MTRQENYKISKILAEEIKDSRENPTIKVSVFVGDISDSFSVPSGASTGIHEAHELRDVDGKGVQNAIKKVNTVIASALVGQDVLNQKEIDRLMIELDGTKNKDNLGANSMVGVSIACAKTAAKVTNQEVYQYLQTLIEIKPSRKVPYLFINLLEGGKHTDNGLAFQEYHVIPNVEDATEALDMSIKIQNTLKEIITKDLGEESLVLGDEGGFAPKTKDIRKPLLYLTEAIKQNNLQDKVYLSLDVASSSFFKDGIYEIAEKKVTKEELFVIYKSLISKFNLFSIEDPFDEEDFESFKKIKDVKDSLFIVGDDLTVSNQILLKKAIEKGSVNAMIIKPNQIGTLSETLETMRLARENNIEIIVSHRSGETNDDFISDLAYAFSCFGLKTGSSFRPERMVKYQRLIEISK